MTELDKKFRVYFDHKRSGKIRKRIIYAQDGKTASQKLKAKYSPNTITIVKTKIMGEYGEMK